MISAFSKDLLDALSRLPLTPVIACAMGSLLVHLILRVRMGLRMSLYLVNDDSVVKDQSLIPVTCSARKCSLIQCLREGRWRDDVELTLMDYQRRAYRLRVTYGLWRRFTVEFMSGPEGLKIARRALQPGRRYRLRSGMRLEAGGRRYEVRVLPDRPELALIGGR